MANGGIPDIGVRLTAQGVQDVVNAFKRVRQEGAAAGKGAAEGFSILNASLETLRELLPAVSAAVVIERVVSGAIELGLKARESAENIGKLSEKTGAAVGSLSALNLAAHDAEVDQESFGKGLIKLARNMQDAATGAAKPKKAFTDLGISLQDLQSKDPAEIFALIATKLAAMPDSAHKAQIAIALFGKTGADLIPLLNSLGKQGFDQAVEKAKKFGVYLSQDLVDNARAAQDAVHKLEDIASGLGTNLVDGFAEPLTTAIEGVAEEFLNLTGQKGQFSEWGLLVGEQILNVAEGFADLDRYIKTTVSDFYLLRNVITRPIDSTLAVVGGTAQVREQAKAGIEASKKDLADAEANSKAAEKTYADTIKRLESTRRRLYPAAPPSEKFAEFKASGFADIDYSKIPSAKPKRGTGGADGDGTDEAQKEKAAKELEKQQQALSAYEQSKADNRLAILKASNTIAEAEDKRHYEAGLLTVDAYYDKVEARASKELADEIAALDQKRAGAENLPDATVEQRAKKATEIEKIDAQISETAIRYIGIQAAAEDERTKAKHDNAIKELEDEEKLARAAGDARSADQIGLALELQQYSELLQKRKDLTEEQKKAALDSYTVRGNAKIDFATNSKAAGGLNEDLNAGIGAIQDQAASGAISDVSAQARILDIERQRLPALIAIGQVLAQNAAESKDPDLIRQAEAYNASIKHIEVSLKNVTTAQTYLFNSLAGQGRQDFEDFFTAIGDGSKSAGDAFKDLADSFEQQIARMVSKLLVFYALEEIVGFVAPDSDFLKTLSAAGPFGKFAGGGWTGGKAGKVAGVVHGEDFVVKAGAAAANLPLLQAINAGSMPAIRSIASTSSVASDYAASISGDAPAAPVVQVINTTGQPTQQKQTTGSGGKSITQIIVGAVQQDIASGGLIAKQVESQYALARGGTRRG